MNRSLIEIIKIAYPTLFNYEGSERESVHKYGLEAPTGWFDLLHEALGVLSKNPNAQLWQVKEKFGGLRIYGTGFNDADHEAISTAEKRASRTCTSCGNPSDGTESINGWMYTLCKAHKKEKMEEPEND